MLGQYKFKILYTLGKDNGRADALSRRSDYIVIKDVSEELILRQEKDRSLTLIKQLAIVMQIFGYDIGPEIRKAYNEDPLARELRKA